MSTAQQQCSICPTEGHFEQLGAQSLSLLVGVNLKEGHHQEGPMGLVQVQAHCIHVGLDLRGDGHELWTHEGHNIGQAGV